jgi:hypothetical protein
VDPVSLIVGALSAGAASGLRDSAGAAVADAYAALRQRIARLLSDTPSAEAALAQYAIAPDVWRGPLIHELERAGAARNSDIIEAALQLIRLIKASGTDPGIARIDLLGAQGVQVNNDPGNTQNNDFRTGANH